MRLVALFWLLAITLVSLVAAKHSAGQTKRHSGLMSRLGKQSSEDFLVRSLEKERKGKVPSGRQRRGGKKKAGTQKKRKVRRRTVCAPGQGTSTSSIAEASYTASSIYSSVLASNSSLASQTPTVSSADTSVTTTATVIGGGALVTGGATTATASSEVPVTLPSRPSTAADSSSAWAAPTPIIATPTLSVASAISSALPSVQVTTASSSSSSQAVTSSSTSVGVTAAVTSTYSAPATSTSASTAWLSDDPSGYNGPYNGETTYYNLGTDGSAIGACGTSLVDSDYIAAASYILWQDWPGATANPNDSPICGLYAEVTYGSNSVIVRIEDQCPGCDERHLDLSPIAFQQLADESVGMMDVTWKWVETATG